MKIKTKKLLAIILSFAVLLSASPLYSFAAEKAESKEVLDAKANLTDLVVFPNYSQSKSSTNPIDSNANYLALGDSIPQGYGLKNIETENFVALINQREGITASNQGISGQTSLELKNEMITNKKYDAAIESAEYITITVGGNDLIAILYQLAAENYNASNDPDIKAEEVPDILSADSDSRTFNLIISLNAVISSGYAGDAQTDFQDGASAVLTNIEDMITYIKTKNNTAKIYVTNQYNPYKGFTIPLLGGNVGTFFEGALTDNEGINGLLNGLTNCEVVDIYTTFDTENTSVGTVTNAEGSNFDFHPTKAGHELYASALKDIEMTVSPETDAEVVARVKNLILGGEVTVAYSDKDNQVAKTAAVQTYVEGLLNTTGVTASVVYKSGNTYTVSISKNSANDSKDIDMTINVSPETDAEVVARVKNLILGGEVTVAYSDKDNQVAKTAAVQTYVEGLLNTTGVTASVAYKSGNTYTVNIIKNGINDSKDIDMGIRLIYSVIEGQSQKLIKGANEDLQFKTEGNIDEFLNLYLNDDKAPINKVNYTFEAGSVIFNLKAEYINTLPAGEHKFTAEFADGEAELYVEIQSTSETDSPQTGDDSNLILFTSLVLISLGGIGIVFYRRKMVK